MNDRLSSEEVARSFPFFTEPGLQQVIANQGRIHRFREGEVIMDYGSYVRMLPLVLSGTIKISRLSEDGTELFLYYLGRGDSCTMTFSCCMHHKKSEIRAVAEEDTVVLGLPQQYLDVWMTRYVSWKNFVLRAYDERLNELLKTIDQITFHRLDDRLLEYLRERAGLHPGGTIQATHQEIAGDLHASREAISRLLKSLEQRGVVTLGRNQVTLVR